ncbi:MAG: histidine kinase [Bacteroidota bacterium]
MSQNTPHRLISKLWADSWIMKDTAPFQKKLLVFALISSPLIGLFSFLPLALLFETFVAQLNISFTPFSDISLFGRIVTGILAISISVFIIWLLNIWLFNFFQRNSFHRFKILRYLGSYVFTLAFLAFVFYLRTRVLSSPIDLGYVRFYPLIGGMANNTFILILIDLLVNQQARSDLELEKAQLEINNLVARQEQLKQQIHPHFLFNSLSTMGSLIKKEPNEAYLYVQKLAGFLRTSLTMAQDDVVSIKEDLYYFEEYMQLQKTRFGKAINYEVRLSDTTRSRGKLPVFTLQQLGENAIKHNAFSKSTPLHLLIEEKNECIWVSNNILNKYSIEKTTQLGLKNLSNRYILLGSKPPEILEMDNEFSVILNIIKS